MTEAPNIRRQATLFLKDASPSVEECRWRFNPAQAKLIAAHVTLCREYEVEDWQGFEKRVAKVVPIALRLTFGQPIRDGNLVLLPVTEGAKAFDSLRCELLSNAGSQPRAMNAHLTIVHPRNGTCTDANFEEIVGLVQPFQHTFAEIAIIEQANGGPWNVLSLFN